MANPLRLLWLAVFLVVAGGAQAQGIDCRAARAPLDRAICADPGLLEQDRALARAFAAGLARDPAGAAALRREELAWLAARNRECGSLNDAGSRRGCLARQFAQRIAELSAPAAIAAAGPLPVVEPGAATLEATALKPAERMETLLRVTGPGRFAITAKSASGVALQLVDMLAGPGEVMGQAGSADGRVDALLDRGVYKLRAFAAQGAAGEVALAVMPFQETAAADRLGPDVAGELADLQQRSFWFAVAEGEPVRIEAAGRALGDLAVWRDGIDLVPLTPEVRLIEPLRGHPLTYMALRGKLAPGTYRLTAYGGRALVWADGAGDRPFHLRATPSAALASGWTAGAIGPFGSEVFALPAEAAELRLDLPQPAPVRIALEGGGAAAIARDSRAPVARLAVPPGQGTRLVEVSGAEGQAYQLRALGSAGPRALSGPGTFWISADAIGFGADEPPASVVFARRNANDPPTVAAAAAPRIGPGLAWRQSFNLRGPVTVLVQAVDAGPVALRAEGVAVQAELVPLGGTPPLRADGASPTAWSIPAGWHQLILTPVKGAVGVVDVTLGPLGLAASPMPAQPADPAWPLGLVTLGPAQRLELYSGQATGGRIGLAARAAPVNLAAGALAVTQAAAAVLEVPVRLPGDGTVMAMEVGVGTTEASFTGEPGPLPGRIGVLRIPGADHARNLVLSWQPPARPPVSVPPPARREALPPLAAGTPRFADMENGQMRGYALDVPEGGLFRVETLGRLRTQGAIGTAFIPALDRAEANGIGQNLLIQRFLRAGSYRVEATALASAGRMGIAARPAPIQPGATLVPGGSVRAAIGADEAVAFPIEIPAAGRYHLELLSLARGVVARLEDAQGWPMLPAGDLSSLDQDLLPGNYRLLVQPAGIAARVVARLSRLEAPAVAEGHGPFELAFGTPGKSVWREPSGRDQPRLPDEWRFTLLGAAPVTLTISDGMVTDLMAGDATLARFTTGFEGTLPAGAYRIRAASLGRNDRLDYTLSLASESLQPGRPRNVTLPATLNFAIAADRVAGVTSFGPIPLRAVLKRADGSVVERFDDRGDDWNIGFSRLLPAGDYVLELASAVPGKGHAVRPGDAPAPGSDEATDDSEGGQPMAEPSDDEQPSGDAAPTVEVRLAVPEERPMVAAMAQPMPLLGGGVHRIELPPAEGLTVVAAASSAALVLALEQRDPAGTWRSVATAQGVAPVVGGLLGAGWRASVWTLDGGSEPIRLATSPATPGALGFDGLPQRLAVAALPLGDGPMRVPGDSEGLEAVSAAGGVLRPVEGGMILPQGPRAWLLGRTVPGALEPIPVEPGAPLALSVPAGAAAVLPAASDGLRVWRAESGFGQPGIEAGRGMGVAAGSALALAAGPARIFGAGGAKLRLRATALDLATPEPRLAPDGFSEPVPPGRAIALRLPAGAQRVRVDLAPGIAAIANWRDPAAVTVWGGADPVSRVLEADVTDLLLLNTGPAPAPAAVSWTPRDGAPLALRPGVAVKRFFGAAGSLDLPVTGPGRLVVAGGSATFVSGTTVTRGTDFAVPAAGRLVLEHGVGLLAAWMETDGVSPWPTPAPQAVALPGIVKLSGPAMALALDLPGPALLHASSTAPVILALNDEAPALYPAGAELHRMVSGRTLLRVVSPHDGALAGTLALSAAPIVPASEGIGPMVALAPGETAAFGFDIARAGAVGVGIRAEPDHIAARLLDANGRLLGEGVAQLQRLPPGRYVLEARAAPDAGTVLVRPAVIGIAPHGNGPPQDIVNRYLELAGRAPVLVAAPGRAP